MLPFKNYFIGFGIIIIALVVIYGYKTTRTIPDNFPVNKNFIVGEGESLRSISGRLKNENYISSELWFRVWVSILGSDRHIQLGEYIFDKQLVLGAVVKKLTSGNPDIPLIRVTIPEGSTTNEIALIIKKVLPNFSVNTFNQKVVEKNVNGKLFPSTYFLLPSTTEDRSIEIMVKTFEKKYLESFKDEGILSPLKNENDVLSLAAILEGEAKKQEDMKIVAGILLKRLKLNMPLQVDAAPETYKVKGLPNIPINNPGLIAIDSAFNPTSTDYLFYITGKDDLMHYSKTFTEHKANIKKYLK